MYGDSAFCLSVKLGAVFFLIKELCKKEPNNAAFLEWHRLASCIGKAFLDLKKYQIQNCANPINDSANKILELEESINNLPEFSRLWAFFEPEADDINTKFIALVQSMHDRGMGWQSHHFRVQNLAIDRLRKKLVTENTGTDVFFETEKLLINMQDLKLKNQINELRIGEVLNSETPSRHFLDIAKCKNISASLDDIKKDCGSDFECQNDRAQYISQFYKNLYNLILPVLLRTF
jgi:hypothetical protein